MKGRAKHTYTLLLRLLGEVKGETVDIFEADGVVQLVAELG